MVDGKKNEKMSYVLFNKISNNSICKTTLEYKRKLINILWYAIKIRAILVWSLITHLSSVH